MLSVVKPLLSSLNVAIANEDEIQFVPTAETSSSPSANVVTFSMTSLAENGNVSNGTEGVEDVAMISYWAFVLLVIPLATIFGNLLVMVSVIRVKSLHSNVNYLVFALAVADLFVAVAVMPYAVYTEVNSGTWRLGPLLCDVYCASDVSCCTASILTLTLISFDRYQAVTKPIQYSQRSRDVKRILLTVLGLWLISLVTASPMVLGLNTRPPGVKEECRFYNAEFSLISTAISFAVPLVLILFVYARILMALRTREKVARMRRPSQRHEPAVVAQPDRVPFITSSPSPNAEQTTSSAQGPIESESIKLSPAILHKQISPTQRSSQLSDDDEQSWDSNSEHQLSTPIPTLELYPAGEGDKPASCIVTAASVSEGLKTLAHGGTSAALAVVEFHLRSPIYATSLPSVEADNSSPEPKLESSSSVPADQNILMNDDCQHGRRFSDSSEVISTGSTLTDEYSETLPMSNESESQTLLNSDCETMTYIAASESETFVEFCELSRENSFLVGGQFNPIRLSNKSTVNSQIRPAPLARCTPGFLSPPSSSDNGSLVSCSQKTLTKSCSSSSAPTQNVSVAIELQARQPATPVVAGAVATFELPTNEQFGSVQCECDRPASVVSFGNVVQFETTTPRRAISVPVPQPSRKRSLGQRLALIRETAADRDVFVANGGKTEESERNLSPRISMKDLASSPLLAMRFMKKTICRNEGGGKKGSKTQRKERKATKTLGIVVGVFLFCWLPFFSLNVLNAVCLLFDWQRCQVGFLAFFLSTWLGYMNSFMNPIIYTIYNTEFRRAFKLILLPKRYRLRLAQRAAARAATLTSSRLGGRDSISPGARKMATHQNSGATTPMICSLRRLDTDRTMNSTPI